MTSRSVQQSFDVEKTKNKSLRRRGIKMPNLDVSGLPQITSQLHGRMQLLAYQEMISNVEHGHTDPCKTGPLRDVSREPGG